MDYTVSCRDISELNPLVQVMYNAAIKEIKASGVNPLVIETYRPLNRQYYLYCHGRSASVARSAGVPAAIANKYCPKLQKKSKVTWTLNSYHIQRKAIDIIPQRKIKGKMTAIWNVNDVDTQKIISIMTKYGFEAGANWQSNPDSPHYQVKADYNKVFDKSHNTTYVTKTIQRTLNKIKKDDKTPLLKTKQKVDGKWGDNTTKAVNKFRKFKKYSNTTNGVLGATALKALLKYV